MSADTETPPADSGPASDTGDVVEPAEADDQDQLLTITEDEDYTDYRIVAAPAESGNPGEWNFEVVSAEFHTSGALMFIWDFGDGESQEGQAVSHTFMAGGVYTVTVTATRNDRTVFVLTMDIDVTLPDMPPVANAGGNFVVYEGEEVCLDASASYDPNNDPITFTWRQLTGDAVELVTTNDPAVVCFTAPEVEGDDVRLFFAVTVSDGGGSAEDSAYVDVRDPPETAGVLIADAGPDQEVTAGDVVTLDGSGSQGPEGAELTYQWTGPVPIDNADAPIATFVAPDVTYTTELPPFRLTVTYDDLEASDETIVTVGPSDASGGGGAPAPTGCTGDGDCDDQDPCTLDACVDGTCENTPVAEGTPCNDGLFCNGAETCNAIGECQPGAPIGCDDGVGCTVDSCNEDSDSCDHAPNDALCDNTLFCDGAETCDPILDCQAGSYPCPGQLCDEGTDTCTTVECTGNSDCDDGLHCNGAETCSASGDCQPGVPVSCDDGVSCTVDSCNEDTDSCGHAPNDSLCANSLFCDGAEVCDPVNGCQAGSPVNCGDGVACTVDSCNEATDSCDNVPDNSLCDDGSFCNGAEVCDSVNGCQAGSPVDCGDGIACTVDSCNEATDSCDHAPDNNLCDDGLYCDGAEECDPVNGCQAGSPVDCGDGIACTVDSCNEATHSCDHAPDNSLCDDGSFCNGPEVCDSANGCQAGSPVDCGDGIECTVDSCNEAIDSCDNVPDNSFCDDGSFCNGAEICDSINGCQAGAPVDCDDEIVCTDDTCNEQTDSCDHAANDSQCDNSLFCDGAETCDPILGCQSGSDPCPGQLCDEGTDACMTVECTEDSECDDGLYCNGVETCSASNECQPGAPVSCDDGVSCTADSCN
ncbi:MAG: PKD domain-containing protein, partial [Phycisphaerales bacterium]